MHLWIGKCIYVVVIVYGIALNFVLLFNDYFVVNLNRVCDTGT